MDKHDRCGEVDGDDVADLLRDRSVEVVGVGESSLFPGPSEVEECVEATVGKMVDDGARPFGRCEVCLNPVRPGRSILSRHRQEPARSLNREETHRTSEGFHGDTVDVAAELVGVLMAIVQHLKGGHGVTVASPQAELTTEEAAELVNVSQPHLIKLLDVVRSRSGWSAHTGGCDGWMCLPTATARTVSLVRRSTS